MTRKIVLYFENVCEAITLTHIRWLRFDSKHCFKIVFRYMRFRDSFWTASMVLQNINKKKIHGISSYEFSTAAILTTKNFSLMHFQLSAIAIETNFGYLVLILLLIQYNS